jgi:hypothetical protein
MMPPPGYYPVRRKTKEELRQIEKNLMACKIMACLAEFQPKRKKRKRK